MKSISAALEAHIGLETTTLSTCWRVERTDGVILGFTDHDRNIVYDGVTYEADTGVTRSGVKSSGDMSVDQLDVMGLLESDKITRADILAGKYNYAEIYVFLINWADTTQGILRLRRGLIGNIVVKQNQFIAELQGLTQYLQNNLLIEYTPECPLDLGDAKCQFAIDTLKQQTEVLTVTSRAVFTVKKSTGSGSTGVDFSLSGLPSYGLDLGKIEWTSGSNNGITCEIKTVDAGAGQIELFLTAPFTINVGDTLDIWPGCDKRAITCKDDFNNLVNFRGFPHVPGMDNYLLYPNARG